MSPPLTRLIDVSIAVIVDTQRPSSLRFFAPKMNAKEGPVVEIGADDVSRSLEQQRRGRAHRRGQIDAQIAARKEA